jgi:SAM-dependent methyltransferase
MLKEFPLLGIRTDHPHPEDSPDYLDPAGSLEDNHSHPYFIHELDNHFRGMPYRLMDLGCAGGQFAVDIYNKGAPWVGVGIEGGNVHGMTGNFEALEMNGEFLTSARGSSNWGRYKDTCLFNADISKPFDILIGDSPAGSPQTSPARAMMFDIITAYEFLEHPLPTDIPHILQNVKKHLMPNGIFIGTINLSPGAHHRCAKPVQWWREMYDEQGFVLGFYPFQSSPRTGYEFIANQFHLIHSGREAFLIDESVAPPPELHHPDLNEDFEGFNDQNLPFCAVHKEAFKTNHRTFQIHTREPSNGNKS